MKKITHLTCIFILGFIPIFASGFIPGNNISFYQTDLVCRAAPHIGCGSKSKPILLDLMKVNGVKEAWLNRAGTVIAVVWEEKVSVDKTAIAATVFKDHAQSYQELTGEAYQSQLKSFQNGDKWYLGDEVDELTKEEMELIRSGNSPNCVNGDFLKNCTNNLKNCIRTCSEKRTL